MIVITIAFALRSAHYFPGLSNAHDGLMKNASTEFQTSFFFSLFSNHHEPALYFWLQYPFWCTREGRKERKDHDNIGQDFVSHMLSLLYF